MEGGCPSAYWKELAMGRPLECFAVSGLTMPLCLKVGSPEESKFALQWLRVRQLWERNPLMLKGKRIVPKPSHGESCQGMRFATN